MDEGGTADNEKDTDVRKSCPCSHKEGDGIDEDIAFGEGAGGKFPGRYVT